MPPPTDSRAGASASSSNAALQQLKRPHPAVARPKTVLIERKRETRSTSGGTMSAPLSHRRNMLPGWDTATSGTSSHRDSRPPAIADTGAGVQKETKSSAMARTPKKGTRQLREEIRSPKMRADAKKLLYPGPPRKTSEQKRATTNPGYGHY